MLTAAVDYFQRFVGVKFRVSGAGHNGIIVVADESSRHPGYHSALPFVLASKVLCGLDVSAR